MSTPLIPQNQIDALPTLGAPNYVANGGQLEYMPQTFQRYFSPAGCGMNGLIGNASDPATGLFWGYSTEMWCRGCRHFTFTLAVKMRESIQDSDFRPNVYAQAWAAAEPGVRVAPLEINFNVNTWVKVGSMRLDIAYNFIPFPPPVGGVYPEVYKSASCSWDVGGLGNAGNNQDGLTGSMAVRLSAVAGVPDGPLSHTHALLYGSMLASS